MKKPRLFFSLWLAFSIAGCSALPNIPELSGVTSTPSITLTPAPTSTPTITPTPLPVARIAVADRALFNGDYETAFNLYKTSFQDSPDPLVQAAAKWGEARVLFAEARYTEALASLQALILGYPQSTHLAHAHFLQGLTQYRLGNYQAAADSWQVYLTLRPGVLDSYVQELRGDALFNAKNYVDALPAYKAAIQEPHLGDAALLDIKVASTYVELGDTASALALYDGVFARTNNDYIKAQAVYESGLAYQAEGQNEEALAKFRMVVEQYPLSYNAYLSLIELLDSGAQVSELDRGLVDYFAGQYTVAIAAFERFLSTKPAQDGTAYYYLAASYRALGNYDAALQNYATFTAGYPAHPKWGAAWGEKAFIEWFNLGSYPVAAQTLLGYVHVAPNGEFAADYLMSAARIYERSGNTAEAMNVWGRVSREYAGTAQAAEAEFLIGIILYRQKDYFGSLDAFGRSLNLTTDKAAQARIYLWLGKAQEKLGNPAEAEKAWRTAQDKDPGGYYSERARDLLAGRAPFEAPLSMNLLPDMTRLRADADSWVRLTFNLPADTDLTGPGPLATDLRFVRGTELWDLGLYEDARAEFENLRSEVSADAVLTYRLANYMLEIGLYRPAIFAARQVLNLAGLDEHTESMLAPPYFSHVRYGLYYSDLILPDAQKEGINPLFLFSVIRQESLFEGFVQSGAGARGLMQVIPSTGAQIANELGWPPYYEESDLYRPDVSVAFGAHYLKKNLNLFNGDPYAALAAYNGGPGNAAAWRELSGNDPDLFLETVRFEETRNYIRNIYEIYIIYRRLYGSGS